MVCLVNNSKRKMQFTIINILINYWQYQWLKSLMPIINSSNHFTTLHTNINLNQLQNEQYTTRKCVIARLGYRNKSLFKSLIN